MGMVSETGADSTGAGETRKTDRIGCDGIRTTDRIGTRVQLGSVLSDSSDRSFGTDRSMGMVSETGANSTGAGETRRTDRMGCDGIRTTDRIGTRGQLGSVLSDSSDRSFGTYRSMGMVSETGAKSTGAGEISGVDRI